MSSVDGEGVDGSGVARHDLIIIPASVQGNRSE
jgi:hypothetical protein